MVDRSREKFPLSYRQSHPRLSRLYPVEQRPVLAGLCHVRLSLDDRFRRSHIWRLRPGIAIMQIIPNTHVQ
jgi:hypothetical protein